jgi:hypothetical protein
VTKVEATSESVIVEVASTAQSATGYPYPRVLEDGTKGDIVPVRAKMLAFPKGGKTVFARRLKQRVGTKFFSRAVQSAKPFIEGQFRSARDRVAKIVTGG